MKKYIDSYNKVRKDSLNKKRNIQIEISNLEVKINQLERERVQTDYPNWIQAIVNPLAQKLSKDLNLEFDIYGPLGVNARTTIYLMEDIKKGIIQQATYSITLIPSDLVNGIIHYETGETTDEYPKGSIGELNGMNYISKELPEYSEIVKIVKNNYSKKRKETL